MEEVEAENHGSINWETHVVLRCGDVKPIEYVVTRKAARMSRILGMLEEQEEGEATVIPIPVNGRTMKYVVQYIEHHWNQKAAPIEKPLRGKIHDVISEWDKKFLFTDLVKNGDEKEHELLTDCTMAADFLQIPDLLDLTCACFASMIKGKSPGQIHDLFNINDFTPEEEERIRQENRWCEEA
eukprot:TRINITY_DN10309_c0_g1_i1.p1 TRINITY_DN10309_c0_g1~~TRINITY_DN10309_c0_g1_i1.p1  ORF type:complete len:183 (-),score=34.70 TRINITY_DN10309_c0_g1_i1:70-618(-)